MSVPVRTASGPKRNAVELVKVRVMGQAEAVAQVAALIRGAVHVAEESGDVARRNDLGVRRYLEVLLVLGAATPADIQETRPGVEGVRNAASSEVPR